LGNAMGGWFGQIKKTRAIWGRKGIQDGDGETVEQIELF